jgi:hypothetical protein
MLRKIDSSTAIQNESKAIDLSKFNPVDTKIFIDDNQPVKIKKVNFKSMMKRNKNMGN